MIERPELTNVRMIPIDGRPWFVAADVAVLMGLENRAGNLTRLLSAEQPRQELVPTTGGMQMLSLISLAGVMEASERSQSEFASNFRKWARRVVTDHAERSYLLMTPGHLRPHG